MGIDTLVREPIRREPIDLFHDWRYSAEKGFDLGPNTVPGGTGDLPDLPTSITVEMADTDEAVPLGTRVIINSFGGDAATVWALEPNPRCLGAVAGVAGRDLAVACKVRVGSIPGIVSATATGEARCEVRIGVE